MPYVLPDIFLDKISSLQHDYERAAGITLNDASQPYALSIYFGAKNVTARNEQLRVIAFFLKYLNNQLQPDLPFKNDHEILQHINALMIMVTLSLFIKSKTSHYSVLRGLIDNALYLNDTNPMDSETWKKCLQVTEPFLNTNCLPCIDDSLKTILQSFADYVREECALITEKPASAYPITTALLPLFEVPLQAAGTTTGYVIGDICGRSASLLYTPYVITATLGSGAFWMMGATTGIGMFLIAPVIAGQLINTLCSVSMAYILGTTMRLAGTVIGGSSGLLLDVSWLLLSKTCSLIADSLTDTQNRSGLTGLMLLNDHRVINGIEFTVSNDPVEHDKHLQKPVIFTLKKDCLSIQIGEEKALIPLDLNNPCIARLYQTLHDYEQLQQNNERNITPLCR